MIDHSNDAAIRLILEGTAPETGEEFFRALVKRLSEVLKTAGAWITEYNEKQHRLRALAFWMESKFITDFDYPIADTPCEEAIRSRALYHVVEDISKLFPNDPYLEPLRAVSYLGMPLLDKNLEILGHLAVLDTKPMPREPHTENVFRIFAARAGAELQRIRAESQIREREAKLTLLINSAMDAIVELDDELKIIRINASGEKVFHKSAAQLTGLSFPSLLSAESSDKLNRLVRDLRSAQASEKYSWIPGGFQILTDQQGQAATEGSLSRYVLDGKNYFAIILRDIRDQIEAERRIATLTSQKEYLLQELSSFEGSKDLTGSSDAWRKVLHQVQQVAGSDACVLITGETGTGKELIARAIHAASRRRDAPLIKVNCAAIPESLIESEFFGHEKGAFTGATGKRAGRFALADGGTLFLDEVGELSVDLQSKLLRVLQEGEFEPVGSSHTQKVDVRIIAATNRNLMDAIRKGRFREDLFYRLHVFPIEMPSLRERGDDVVLLAQKFADLVAHKMDKRIPPLTPDAKRRLKAYSWPGNVRELQNVIERAVITSVDGEINIEECLPPAGSSLSRFATNALEGIFSSEQMEEFERKNIVRALETCNWRVSGKDGAAALLGVPPTTLSSRMKSLKIARPFK